MVNESNRRVWLDMFMKTMEGGQSLAPRGEVIREMEDYQFTINPMYPFMNFIHRNLKVDYFKKEMLWKLTGDPYNDSIKQHAAMWSFVQNSDGSFNSNYGQYWFGEQAGLFKAFAELARDIDSRRAVIPMLNASHIGPHINDTVCTEAVGFRIRHGRLNMSVHMRSSDQIFGLGTDLPTFAFLQRLLLGMLQSVYIVSMGSMTVTAMSSHIYQRHFKMVDSILEDGRMADLILMPRATPEEAFKLASCGGKVDANWGELSAWLIGGS